VDIVLRGGTVVDGTGTVARALDVGCRGDQIVGVGRGLTAAEVIDCEGHVICPGFIDTHSHSDIKLLVDPQLPEKLRQGITLEVLGQDGISVAPVNEHERKSWKQKLSGLEGDFGVEWDWLSVRDYLRRVESAKPAQDIAYLVPHGAIRQLVMGGEDRRATGGELTALQEALRDGIEQGGCGLSTGLIYPPCCYADTDELIALGHILKETNTPLVVHMRSESDFMPEALDEMIAVAEASGCAVHVSHLKIAGRENWSRAQSIIDQFENARARGIRLTADQYPYAAGSTLLGAILPPWAHAGGTDATLAHLRAPQCRARLRSELSSTDTSDWDNFWRWSGPAGILVADIPSGRHPHWIGKSLSEIAALTGKDPFDAAFDLLLEEKLGVAMISFSQSESVVEQFMKLPYVNGCTDGLLGGRPHPRAYGSFPRVLGHYVRERRALSLEEAIRKLTSQAAEAFGFADVGRIAPGMRANLVVFDPDTVADTATFEDPIQFSAGIRDVIVAGRFAVRDETLTGERPGRVVRWQS